MLQKQQFGDEKVMSIQDYMNATKNNIRVQKLYESPMVNKKDATLSAQLNSKPDSFEKEKRPSFMQRIQMNAMVRYSKKLQKRNCLEGGND